MYTKPRIRISLTEALCKEAEKIADGVDNGERSKILRDEISRNMLTLDSLNIVKSELKRCGDVSLRNLLEGSKLVYESRELHKNTSENKDLAERRKFLILRKQTREYNQMVYGQDSGPDSEMERGAGFSSFKSQLSVSTNMIMTVFVMFGVGYYAGRSFSTSESVRMTCGLVTSIGTMILEMTLFVIRAVQFETRFETAEARNVDNIAALAMVLCLVSVNSITIRCILYEFRWMVG